MVMMAKGMARSCVFAVLLAAGCSGGVAQLEQRDGAAIETTNNQLSFVEAGTATAAPDAAAPEISDTPVVCEVTPFLCQEYVGVAPPASCVPSPGPCPTPADPSDVCVVGPGHLEIYYHTIIPTDGGEGIPYGVWPPADCVHPPAGP